ncbi:MAG: 4-alpha-glucanotransferase, partial [Propionibacteriaceae bacterium]|nr:4-alpha-glucanotransferase [Propionibacteriaceae bacterium]
MSDLEPDVALSREELVKMLAPLGVADSYINAAGRLVTTKTETLGLVAQVFTDLEDGAGDPIVCTPGRYHPGLYGTMIMAGGHTYRAVGYINEVGYHVLYTDDGLRHLVICAPDALRTPPRSWGWQVQLYASRTAESWGIGDFRDLALICRKAAQQGASCVQVSPVHAVAPTKRPQDSPYSPASRTFLNVLHIAPGLAPGAERVNLEELSKQGRALNEQRLIDRSAVWALKKQALQLIWDAQRDTPSLEFTAWREATGKPLQSFSIWCAIVEELDSPEWQQWPKKLRRPTSSGVAEFAATHADRVTFYAWCQFVAQQQYVAACHSGVDVVADVAVGFDSHSEDAWAYQDDLCFSFEIGAPPDTHNIEGQRWGLPPFNPRNLQHDDFR